MDRNKLADALKGTLFHSPSLLQIDGITAIIDSSIKYGITDIRQVAYILATVYHETNKKMQPTEEAGYLSRANQMRYLKKQDYYPYYGRDLTHTTWKDNYKKVKDFSGIDVVTHPELIGQMPLAADVAVYFMKNGFYTGRKLSKFFYPNSTDKEALAARQIINPKDYLTYQKVFSYYKLFLNVLKQISWDANRQNV